MKHCGNSTSIPYSTVADLVSFIGSDFNEFPLSKYDYLYLKFDVSIKSSVLTKTSHYNFTQKEIYRITKDLHENDNKNFKEISLYLTQKGYRTVRSNKEFKSNHVFSIYRKGKIREERINREFKVHYGNFRVIPYVPL